MSFELLSDEERKNIRANLPDVNLVCNRILQWKKVDWIVVPDSSLTKKLRLSNVKFRDAAHCALNAYYSLREAIATRQYYFSLSKEIHDEYHFLSDTRSRFYADYVPLLLVAASEHILTGLLKLFPLQLGEGKYRLKRILNAFKKYESKNNITDVLQNFDSSQVRKKILEYRDDWVHNKPPMVESFLYNPPLDDYSINLGDTTFFGFDVTPPEDYKWDELIELLKEGLHEIAILIQKSADEWERIYNQCSPIINSNNKT